MRADGYPDTFAMLERAASLYGQAYFIYSVEEQRFKYVNQAFYEVWTVTADTFMHQPELLLQDIHPEDRPFVISHYQAQLEGREQKRVEFRLVGPEGKDRWICVASHAVTEAGRPYICGYAEDISTRKAYLYNLIKFNTKKNSTLEILSHDLAAPFVNIKGLVDLLEMRGMRENSQVWQLLEYIRQDAQRGTNLIRAFVNNEFLESSKVEVQKERVDIVHRLEEMISTYEEGAHLIEKQFVLQAAQKPVFVYIDEMKFMQAINNLISNAIKFTPEHGTITVTVEDRGSLTLLSVADNGIGIPDALKPVLFDKFTKARRSGLRGEEPVGMGMSIIRNIVELHQGRIWFESTEGQGSVFYIELPKE